MPNALWAAIDDAARRLEFSPTGYLINYFRSRGAAISREWRDLEKPSYADRIVVRLRIASRVHDSTESHRELMNRLTSTEGWRAILAEVAEDDSVAYAVKRLIEWVKSDGSLSRSEKEAIGTVFRSYLRHLLLSPAELWPIAVSALNELAKAFVALKPDMSPDERTAFRVAVLSAADWQT